MSSSPTIACVLRSGGDFEPRHVQWLAKQVPGLICLSDQKIVGVETRPLKTDWPGWWAKMEAFGPSIEGDMLLMDLDTVVLRMPELPKETTVLSAFNTKKDLIGSGFMYVTAADRARVWEAFNADPKGHMARNKDWSNYGDQGFLQHHLSSAARWGDNVRSYKQHCLNGVPEGTDVIVFHGKPRPWMVAAPWIPPLPFNDFRDLILRHAGKRICVMGGGKSLIEDLEKIEADVYISTNAHGADVVRVDYVLSMDEKHQREGDMGKYLRKRSNAPIISPHAYADYRLANWPQHPRWVLSGLVGTWAAFMMGAKVVILAGCDAYEGKQGYIEEARKISRDVKCPVRVASGPLQQVWALYDKAEDFGPYQPHSSIRGWFGDGEARIRVRARKPCLIGHQRLQAGQEAEVYRHEARRMLKHRMVEEI